ncbi:MAG: efflux RND transporter permease subunit, partial [Rhodospirillaceae bacterium]|nr:efflux RND transporter permease subunit [Rhodospirillaceae bacterium]
GHVGGMFVQLVPADRRTIQSEQFIAAWKQRIRSMPGQQQLKIKSATGGPPGRDVDVRLTGASTVELKKAAEELKLVLKTIPGVRATEDNLPYGKIETLLELTPRGRALGFTTESVGRQVRNTFEGAIAKRFARGDEEVVVRVRFPKDRLSSEALHSLHLRAPNGRFVPLGAVVSIREKQGFARVKSEDGLREVAVTADLNTRVMTTQQAVAEMKKSGLDDIARKYGVEYRFEGRDKEQRRTFKDMQIGAGIGLTLIFIILAWVFAGYLRPLVVMSVIPMGFIGAVLGHYLMGFDLSILSLIALIGLSGIVVNNSIILVSVVKERIDSGEPVYDAIANGARDRLRAIILTSATTIGGLTPLLFETDLQARFLIPMAITLVFGLMVATLLVLFVVPSLIAIQADFGRVFQGRDPRAAGVPVPAE